MLRRDRFGNHISVETGDIRSPLAGQRTWENYRHRFPSQRNIPAVYTRPGYWETTTPIANLPAVGDADAGVLAQSVYNRRLYQQATRPQTRQIIIRPQQKPIGRGRPVSLIDLLLGR